MSNKQVHISEARVATALDKLAYMEALVNDRLLQDRSTTECNQASPSPSASIQSLDTPQGKLPRKRLDVSGPVQPYHPRLKNFWYPAAFSTDLKEDTMVCWLLQSLLVFFPRNIVPEYFKYHFVTRKSHRD